MDSIKSPVLESTDATSQYKDILHDHDYRLKDRGLAGRLQVRVDTLHLMRDFTDLYHKEENATPTMTAIKAMI